MRFFPVLLTLSFCLGATTILHAAGDKTKVTEKKTTSHVTTLHVGAVPHSSDKTFYYSDAQPTLLTATTKGSVSFSWQYLHSDGNDTSATNLPKTGWIKIPDATGTTFDFKQILQHNNNTPGIYFIRPRTNSHSTVVFVVFDFVQLQATPSIAIKNAPLSITAVTRPDIPCDKVEYTFTGDGISAQSGSDPFFYWVENDRFTGSRNLQIKSATPGEKTVTATLNGITRSVTVNVPDSKFSFIENEIILPSSLDLNDPARRKFKKLELNINPNLLGIYRDNGFYIVISNSNKISTYHKTGDTYQKISFSTPLPPFPPGHRRKLSDYTHEQNLEFLNNLHIANSITDLTRQQTYRIEIYNSEGKPVTAAATNIITVNPWIRYAVGAEHLPGAILSPSHPLNVIYNPAVIVINNKQNPADPIAENHSAIFQLGDPNLDNSLLKNRPDLIEWHINPPELPLPNATLEQGTAEFIHPQTRTPHITPALAHGYQVQINGLTPGFLKIGVKVKGDDNFIIDYLCLTGPEKQLPYCFKFTALQKNDPRIESFINTAEEAIKVVNIIYRQSGLKFMPVSNPEQLIPPEDPISDGVGLSMAYYNKKKISQLNPLTFPLKLHLEEELDEFDNLRLEKFTRYKIYSGGQLVAGNLKLTYEDITPFGSSDHAYTYSLDIPITNVIPVDATFRILPDASLETLDIDTSRQSEGIYIYSNVVPWLLENVPEDFPNISLFNKCLNIYMHAGDTRNEGYETDTLGFAASHPINSHLDYLQTEGLFSETGAPTTISMPRDNRKTIYNDDFGICHLYQATHMDESISNEKNRIIWELAFTIAHEIGHTRGLKHRFNTPNTIVGDSILAYDILPIREPGTFVDIPNIMYSYEDPRLTDFDLMQSFVMRNGLLVQDVP